MKKDDIEPLFKRKHQPPESFRTSEARRTVKAVDVGASRRTVKAVDVGA